MSQGRANDGDGCTLSGSEYRLVLLCHPDCRFNESLKVVCESTAKTMLSPDLGPKFEQTEIQLSTLNGSLLNKF